MVAEESSVNNAGGGGHNDRESPKEPIITPGGAATKDCVIIKGEANRVIHEFSINLDFGVS